jgi:hypothetical protein
LFYRARAGWLSALGLRGGGHGLGGRAVRAGGFGGGG